MCWVSLNCLLGKFLEVVNKIRSCTTPGCKGHLVGVKCRGLGGGLAVSYSFDGCALKGAVFKLCAPTWQYKLHLLLLVG